MSRKWCFVDYENIGNLEGFCFAPFEQVFIYLGPQQKTAKMPVRSLSSRTMFTFFHVEECSKNNVDFHIAYQLGSLQQETDPDIEFVLLSNDKGYDPLIQTMLKQGRSCWRVAHCKQLIQFKNCFIKWAEKSHRPAKRSSLLNSVNHLIRTKNLPLNAGCAISFLEDQGVFYQKCNGSIKWSI